MKKMEFRQAKAEAHKPVSVLEGEGAYFHRILSREPSVGNSNRFYLQRSPGQIPFKWERQPGKCKFDPPEMDPVDIPRIINPPPVSASKIMELSASRLSNGVGPKGYSSSWSKIKFWRKFKSMKLQLMLPRSKNQARGSDEATRKCSLSGSSCASSCDNRMSSSSNSSLWTMSTSSTSSSMSFAAPLQSSNLAKQHNDWPS